MDTLLALLQAIPLLLLVILGFGFIIFVHELGHFLAAKWAGIRVLAFALGFGPALVSWRKGMGFTRGSSEKAYQRLVGTGQADGVSPTEYRLNWLPFGGYVKMLGQEDANPNAVSDAPDSYQNRPVWKRMVVISAGVVFNLIAAAALFIIVFMIGLKTDPPQIGFVVQGSPASRATAVNVEGLDPGLQPGDTVLRVNGRRAQTFNDLVMASAMSRRGESMRVVVEREGVPDPIEFRITPEMGAQSRLLEIGVAPPWTGTIIKPKDQQAAEDLRNVLDYYGLGGVEPGMTLTAAGGAPVKHGAADLVRAVRQSGGAPVPLEFRSEDGRAVTVVITPKAELQTSILRRPSGAITHVEHLLGLMPVMKVAESPTGAAKPAQGLMERDIFARLGSVEFPSAAQGIAEIKRHVGQNIEVAVLRRGEDGVLRRIRLEPPPKVHDRNGGQIGFAFTTAVDTNLVALPPESLLDEQGQEQRPPAAAIIDRPGMRVIAVDGRPVSTFTEIRSALREATSAALDRGESARVTVTLELPIGPDGQRPVEDRTWTLLPSDIRALHDLGWVAGIDLGIFEPLQFTLRAEGSNVVTRAADAVRMGIAETHRVMMMTYATFARLFEGTVKVEHLKGPVGIAHLGTRIASRGLIWLVFFMALISVNLAVVNFLPLPIVDGGQFLFLVLEQIRGRPLSMQVQNIATVAGLILIGTMFLVVTFNDLVGLFG